MKRKFPHAASAAIATLFCLVVSGCESDTTVIDPEGTATVVLKRESVSARSFAVTFTPSENTVRYRYAMGRETDRAAFEAGTLAGTAEQEGAESRTVEFTGLVPRHTYTVFACAYDDSGAAGTVASMKVSTFMEGLTVETLYVTPRSAGFNVALGPDCYKYRYLLGTEADRQGFTDGTAEVSETVETPLWTINYFDLEPEREYVFYARPYDRSGAAGPLYEIPISTPAEKDYPSVELFIDQMDVFQGTYRLVPNEPCGRIDALIFPANGYDNVLLSETGWHNDIMRMVVSWVSVEAAGSYWTSDGPLEFRFQLPDLANSLVLDLYAVVYDRNYEPAGIYKFSPSTPDYDDNAGSAACAVTVSGITAAGADCTYVPNEHTIGVLYEILEADWWDGFVESADYYEGWLPQYLMYEGYWKYTPAHEPFAYTENNCKPGTRYYAAACPINANGAAGFGETTLEEFTTLEQ